MSKYDSMLGQKFGDYIMDRYYGLDGTGHKLYVFKCPVCGDEFVTTPYEVVTGRHKTTCSHSNNTAPMITSGFIQMADDFPPCDCGSLTWVTDINDDLTIALVEEDIFDKGIEYYLAHVVPYSLRLRGSAIARKINELYDMETRLNITADELDDDYEVGDVLEVANVYNMILGYRDDNDVYHRPTLDDIRNALHTVAVSCRIDHIPFLAMPKICTGKVGYDWSEIETIIKEEFTEVYEDDSGAFDDGYPITHLTLDICFQ